MRRTRLSRKLPSQKQWEILGLLDRYPNSTASRLFARLEEEFAWKELATVKTTLRRMVREGLVHSSKQTYTAKSVRIGAPVPVAPGTKISKTQVSGYTAAQDLRELFGQGLLQEIIWAIFGGNLIAFSETILKYGKPNAKEREDIRRLFGKSKALKKDMPRTHTESSTTQA